MPQARYRPAGHLPTHLGLVSIIWLRPGIREIWLRLGIREIWTQGIRGRGAAVFMIHSARNGADLLLGQGHRTDACGVRIGPEDSRKPANHRSFISVAVSREHHAPGVLVGRLPLSCLAPPGLEAEHGVTEAVSAEGIGFRQGRFPARRDPARLNEDCAKFSGHPNAGHARAILICLPRARDRASEAHCRQSSAVAQSDL
jgi:hypothetical protein